MKRRGFSINLFNAVVGASGVSMLANCQTKRSSLATVVMPKGVSVTQALLPSKIYSSVKPDHFDHPDIIRGTPGNRDAVDSHRSISTSYDLELEAATQYYNRWQLIESDELILSSLNSELSARKLIIMQLVYDVIDGSNSPKAFNSIDLVGIRQAMGVESVLSPDDLLRGNIAYIPSRCFELLSRKRRISKVFCNYGTCDLRSFIDFARKRSSFEVLGLPLGFSTGDLESLLSAVELDILDLSGYEIDRALLHEMIKIVVMSSVKWVMLSEFITFNVDEISVDRMSVSKSFKGILGARQIGIYVRPV